jgi:hypothetical protein
MHPLRVNVLAALWADSARIVNCPSFSDFGLPGSKVVVLNYRFLTFVHRGTFSPYFRVQVAGLFYSCPF